MFRLFTFPFLLVFLSAGLLTAQGDAGLEDQRGAGMAEPPPGLSLPTIVKDVSEVMLVFAVTRRSGEYVPDLTQQDFQLLDNGRPPEAVAYFESQTELPLQVGVLLDLSDSVQDHFEFEQKTAITFLERILRPRKDSAFILGFRNQLLLAQDFTDDPRLLADAVMSLRVRGTTALYDAVHAGAAKLGSAGKGNSRRAMVLISDGVDTVSKHTLDESIEAALRAGVVIYALSTNPAGAASMGERVLNLLATSTGGRLLPARSERDLPKAFSRLEEELRSQYALAYRPADLESDGRFRKIKLRPLQRGLRVHTRSGYYAPRPLD